MKDRVCVYIMAEEVSVEGLAMFEKYRKKKEQMEFVGMRKGEYIRFIAMLIVMGVIVLFLFIVLPEYFVKKDREREGLPTKGRTKILPPREIPERIGDKYTEEYKKYLNKKLEELKEGETTDSDILEPKVPPPRVPFKENPDIWKKVVDKADYIPADVQEYVFHMLNSMTQEEIDERAEAVSLKTAVGNPKEFRGEFVHVIGRLLNLENRFVKKKENPSGVTQFWLGRLWRIDDPKTVLFCIFDKDREFECDAYMGDDVELTGVFVMMLNSDYETKTMVEPFVIGRKLKIYRSPSMFENFPWVTMLIIGAVMVGLLMFFILKARAELKETEKFMQKVRAKMMDAVMARQKKSDALPAGGDEPQKSEKPEETEKEDSQDETGNDE